MQEPYHIKVGLQEYYENFHDWTIPDFSDECLICGGANCASYHGYYTRVVICPLTGFSAHDFPVLRFLCKGKGTEKKSNHITFSLLPVELVPFRQLTLKFMILAVWMRLEKHLSLTGTLDAIETELNNLEDVAEFINISSLMSWERLIEAAFELLLSTHIPMACKSQYGEKATSKKALLLFLKTLMEYQYTIVINPIRGPDAFVLFFYQQSGGAAQLAFFFLVRHLNIEVDCDYFQPLKYALKIPSV